MKSNKERIENALVKRTEGGSHQISPKLSDPDIMAGYISNVLESGSLDTLCELVWLIDRIPEDTTIIGLNMLRSSKADILEKVNKLDRSEQLGNRESRSRSRSSGHIAGMTI